MGIPEKVCVQLARGDRAAELGNLLLVAWWGRQQRRQPSRQALGAPSAGTAPGTSTLLPQPLVWNLPRVGTQRTSLNGRSWADGESFNVGGSMGGPCPVVESQRQSHRSCDSPAHIKGGCDDALSPCAESKSQDAFRPLGTTGISTSSVVWGDLPRKDSPGDFISWGWR